VKDLQLLQLKYSYGFSEAWIQMVPTL
jgi:hypothetical protein